MENTQPETIHRGVAIAVIMLDDMQHELPNRPFCSDTSCPCHSDPDLLEPHIFDPLNDGLLTYQEASNLYHGKQITEAGAYRCACPLLDVPCSNPVSAPNGLCASCANGDHRSHGRQVGA